MEHPETRVGRIHHTESFGTVDGPGVRYVVFMQGCPLRCIYCHNPDAIAIQGGETQTAGELVDDILRYKNFIRGVTFSGGEPLMQPEFVAACAIMLRNRGLSTSIDTAGAPSLQKSKPAIDAAKRLLLDIKAADSADAERLTGQGNEISFATLDYCESTQKTVWLRHVLLRGYTLNPTKLRTLAQKLQRYTCIDQIELIPFHKLGEPKWDALGKPYLLRDTPATTPEETAWAKDIFRSYGLPVEYIWRQSR
ncbi:MAG: radical SAM protein [Oscillospiraceae bacterium]|nr:radical SAM protein [Oscillospiraceae bacterium]